jgi:hypothetical protein
VQKGQDTQRDFAKLPVILLKNREKLGGKIAQLKAAQKKAPGAPAGK